MKKIALLLFFSIFGIVFGQKADILNVLKVQEAAWNRGDLDGFMKGYTESDSLLFIGKNGLVYGYKKVLSNYKKSYPNQKIMGKLSFSDIVVRPLGKQYAQVLGKWELAREEPVGGIFDLIFEKKKGIWKIISDHTE